MANQDQLRILRRGVKEWNEWRRGHPVPPDLRGGDLDRVDLRQADLSNANLSTANLIEARLQGANLRGASLGGAYLNLANLCGANLRETDLDGAHLIQADLSEADLGRADLSRADFTQGDLTRANLSGANLSMANLSWARLIRANLTEADLSQAHLVAVDLSGAEMSQAVVGGTVFAASSLATVTGLAEVRHTSPSSIGLDTFFESEGCIPEIFLRGCGVPDVFLQYAASLTSVAFEFYSVFISYASNDSDLARRLHADLQAKGVRCWFAPEDLKIGAKFRTEIDRAIRVHDKLLLLLSTNSLLSGWVEKEVETAFERERREIRTILFPVRLDDAVKDAEAGWAADIRRSRHIGNFTNWKDHDAYQQAFARLLRDLKAESKAPAKP